MTQYRVRFTRTQIVERAPPKGKSGFINEEIPAGTIKVINEASLKFWRDRGNPIEILETMTEEQAKERANQETALPNPTPATPAPTLPTKKAIKDVADAALQFLEAGSNEHAEPLAEALALLASSESRQVLDYSDDTQMVLQVAIEDLKTTGTIPNVKEVADAVTDVQQLTLPPSRRR